MNANDQFYIYRLLNQIKQLKARITELEANVSLFPATTLYPSSTTYPKGG